VAVEIFGSFERNPHFHVAARCCCIHRKNDAVDIILQNPPLRVADYEDGNFAARKVLLVAHVFVRRHKHLESCRLRSIEKVAVHQAVPSSFRCLCNDMALQVNA
jgi:hypothetical protein